MRLDNEKYYQILVGNHWKTFMYNIKHNNLNKPMKDMFQITNNEFHNLRSNAVDFLSLSLKPTL